MSNISQNSSVAEVIKTVAGVAYLKINRNTNCNACASNSSCGIASLGNFFTSKTVLLQTKTKLKLKSGDQVAIEFASKDLIQSAILAYLLPILAFLVGGLLGVWLNKLFGFNSELIPVLLALLGVFVAGHSLKFYQAKTVAINHKLI